MKKIFKPFVIAFVLSYLAGVPLHYLYDSTHFLPFALIAPVNESVWEHLKLAVIPLIISFLILSKYLRPKPSGLFCAASSAILTAAATIIGGHYSLSSGLGLKNPAWDIALYFISMAIAYWVAYKLLECPCSSACCFVLISLGGILLFLILLFTFIPPNLPMFQK